MKDTRIQSRSTLIAAVVCVSLSVGLGGCGSSEPPPPPPVKDTVFGGMIATKEKAKVETEKALEANKQKLEEAMKKQDQEASQ